MNAIFTRRSVRSFTEQPVEDNKIEKLLKAAMQAPSAANQQPWDFLVVRGKDNLDKLSQYNPYASSLKGAALGIVVLGNKNRLKFEQLWQQDLAAATQNILLQAADMGLGTVWYGTAPDAGRMAYISKLFSLEENLLPFSVIAVGYPKDSGALTYVDRYDASRVRFVD